MIEQFKYLFSPIKLGPVTVKNRIVSTPHGTGFGFGNLPTEQFIAYHAERAKGGCGLVEVEGSLVAPEKDSFLVWDKTLKLYDETCVPPFRRFADACHQHGAKVCMELFNTGTPNGQGPSAMPDLYNHVTARAMTVGEIKEFVECYGISAEFMRKAGFDGVEIHASHGFGIHGFLTPLFNRRSDKYGGSLEKRMTYLLEVVDRVRKAIGDGMALGVRLDVDDLIPGGNILEEGKRMAQNLEKTGKVQ